MDGASTGGSPTPPLDMGRVNQTIVALRAAYEELRRAQAQADEATKKAIKAEYDKYRR